MRGFDYPYREYQQLPQSAEGYKAIVASIKQILLTPIGARVMRPTFGSRLPELLFENNTTLLQAQVAQEVKRAISLWEPRVKIVSVNTTADNTKVYVDIEFIINNEQYKTNIELERTGGLNG